MTKTVISTELVWNIANDVLSVNHNLGRWSVHPMTNAYNELAKQSLNMIASFILAKCAERANITIDMTRFPLIAFKRLIEKTINGDIRDDHISEICELGGVQKNKFEGLIEAKILGGMSELKQMLLEVNEEWIETKIYKIATKMATLVELIEISPNDTKTKTEICTKLSSYREELPELVAIALNEGGPEFKFLKEVSNLRGAIRWLKQFRATNCSVLEHLGETAVFAWLMSMEEHPDNNERATELFWCGLFHDLPERWTGDMASPVKDAIEGLRKATEKFEDLMMDVNVYKVLPEHEAIAIKKVLDDAEKMYKSTIKGADYASATMECYRNIMCGSRDEYFVKVLLEYVATKSRFTPAFANLVQNTCKKAIRS